MFSFKVPRQFYRIGNPDPMKATFGRKLIENILTRFEKELGDQTFFGGKLLIYINLNIE